MTDYYDNAYRVLLGGAPMRVFHRGAPAKQRQMIELAVKCGIEVRLEDARHFTYTPAPNAEARITSYRATSMAVPRDTTGYYDGSVRVVVHGVPCRMARKGKHHSMKHWATPEPVTYYGNSWMDRAMKFRKELVAKGSYEAAGVEPPLP